MLRGSSRPPRSGARASARVTGHGRGRPSTVGVEPVLVLADEDVGVDERPAAETRPRRRCRCGRRTRTSKRPKLPASRVPEVAGEAMGRPRERIRVGRPRHARARARPSRRRRAETRSRLRRTQNPRPRRRMPPRNSLTQPSYRDRPAPCSVRCQHWHPPHRPLTRGATPRVAWARTSPGAAPAGPRPGDGRDRLGPARRSSPR